MDWREVVLRVHDVRECAAFYHEALGMRSVPDEPSLLEFPTRETGEARLRLVQAADPRPTLATPRDAFWKLGITVQNLDVAVRRLRVRGIEVTDPAQFEDIGYLCHLRDPSGHALELLQTTFAPYSLAESAEPLGSRAVLAHVTLRVTRLDSVLDSWRSLGIHLISRQPVPRFGFALYFLSTSKQRRPSEDLEAVENREWLWQRPYTCLELQHFAGRAEDFVWASPDRPGLEALQFVLEDGRTREVLFASGDRVLSEVHEDSSREEGAGKSSCDALSFGSVALGMSVLPPPADREPSSGAVAGSATVFMGALGA